MNKQQRAILGHPLWHIVLVASMAVVLVAAAVTIVAVKGYNRETFNLTGSLANSIFVDKISNEEMQYEVKAENDGYLSVSFGKAGDQVAIKFDDPIVQAQADGTWRIGTLDLIGRILGSSAGQTGGYAYELGFTAKKGDITRQGTLAGTLDAGSLDSLFTVETAEVVNGNERFTALKVPVGFAGWEIACDSPYVRKSAEGLLLDDNAALENLDLSNAGDTVDLPLQFVLTYKGVKAAMLDRTIKVSAVPYLDDAIITPAVEANAFGTQIRLKLNVIPRVTVNISNPLVKKVADNEYVIVSKDVLNSMPDAGTKFNFEFNIDYLFNGQIIKTKSMSVPVSRLTPLVVNPIPGTCRDNSIVVSGTVLPGTVVRVNKTAVKLTKNADGTMLFRYKLGVKPNNRTIAVVTAVLAGYDKADATVSTMGQNPANITGVPSSTDKSSFTYVVLTDPGFTVRVTYTFIAPAFGMPSMQKRQIKSGYDNPDQDGYSRATLRMDYNYGHYEVVFQVYNKSKALILTKKYQIYYETTEMKADREFAAKCKNTTISAIVDSMEYGSDMTGKRVAFNGYLYYSSGMGYYVTDSQTGYYNVVYVYPANTRASVAMGTYPGRMRFYGVVKGWVYSSYYGYIPSIEVQVVQDS